MIEPLNIVGALRRGWRLLLLLAVVFAVVAVVLPVSHAKSTVNKKLRWTDTAIVGAPPTAPIGNVNTSVQEILYYANNFFVKQSAVVVAGQLDILDEVVGSLSATATALGAGPSTATTKPVRAARAAAAPVITLKASGSTPQQAAKLANGYVTVVGQAVQKAFQAHLAESGVNDPSLRSGYSIESPAFAGGATKAGGVKTSISSSHKVRLVGGFLVGLILGAAILILIELLDKTVRSAGRAERTFRYPVVAEIPGRPLVKGLQPVYVVDVVGDPDSPAAEAYRMLRMSVLFEPLAAGPPPLDEYADTLPTWQSAGAEPYEPPEPGTRQVIMVLSAGNEVTRPEVAANLGATYAEAGQRAIVISTGNITSGYVSDALPARTGPFGPSDLAARLEPSSLPNVSLLSLHHFVSNSGQLVTLGPGLLDAARELADVVIVETPPLLLVHHAEALMHAVDVVVVVVETGETTVDEGRRASEVLRRLGAPVLGLVLTKVRLSRHDIRQTDRPGSAGTTQAPRLDAAVEPVHEVTTV